jgi:hypothetical protein
MGHSSSWFHTSCKTARVSETRGRSSFRTWPYYLSSQHGGTARFGHLRLCSAMGCAAPSPAVNSGYGSKTRWRWSSRGRCCCSHSPLSCLQGGLAPIGTCSLQYGRLRSAWRTYDGNVGIRRTGPSLSCPDHPHRLPAKPRDWGLSGPRSYSRTIGRALVQTGGGVGLTAVALDG